MARRSLRAGTREGPVARQAGQLVVGATQQPVGGTDSGGGGASLLRRRSLGTMEVPADSSGGGAIVARRRSLGAVVPITTDPRSRTLSSGAAAAKAGAASSFASSRTLREVGALNAGGRSLRRRSFSDVVEQTRSAGCGESPRRKSTQLEPQMFGEASNALDAVGRIRSEPVHGFRDEVNHLFAEDAGEPAASLPGSTGIEDEEALKSQPERRRLSGRSIDEEFRSLFQGDGAASDLWGQMQIESNEFRSPECLNEDWEQAMGEEVERARVLELVERPDDLIRAAEGANRKPLSEALNRMQDKIAAVFSRATRAPTPTACF